MNIYRNIFYKNTLSISRRVESRAWWIRKYRGPENNWAVAAKNTNVKVKFLTQFHYTRQETLKFKQTWGNIFFPILYLLGLVKLLLKIALLN